MNLINQSLSHRPVLVYFPIVGLLSMIIMTGCGGGGGGIPPSPEENVTVMGIVDDGTDNSPLSAAVCDVKDQIGTRLTQFETDSDGSFSVLIPPDTERFVFCHPSNLENLRLATFISTIGLTAGDQIENENVSPATTVATGVIIAERPTDKLQRKNELIGAIETGQDPNLDRLVQAATALFKKMLDENIDVDFGGGGEGGAGGGDGGGAGGSAGDGGDRSNIVGAHCEFVVSPNNELSNGVVLRDSVLADLFDNGELSRPDLDSIKDDINSVFADQKSDIAQAYADIFQGGAIGNAYADVTDDQGTYFIPIPPHVSGFVRCTPPDQDGLVLATYVPARQPNQAPDYDEDVNPAMTLFSTYIASKFSGDLLSTVKENYTADVEEFGELHVSVDNATDQIDGYSFNTVPSNDDVGAMAFTATALYLTYYKNSINNNYLSTLQNFADNPGLDRTAFGLQDPRFDTLYDTLDASANIALGELNTGFSHASQRARLKVKVTDADSPASGGISGATVRVLYDDGVGNLIIATCDVQSDPANDAGTEDCQSVTNANGDELLFILRPGSSNGTDGTSPTPVTIEVTKEGFQPQETTTLVLEVATISVDVALSVAP